MRRLLRCLRCYRRRKRARSISVTITADTGAFMASMSAASEFLAIARYRSRIADERAIGRAFVARLAEKVRADLGLTPHAAHLAAQRPTPAPTEES